MCLPRTTNPGLQGAATRNSEHGELCNHCQQVGLEEITASAGEIRDEGVSPPTLPLRHQRCFDFHHDAIDQVAKTWQNMEG